MGSVVRNSAYWMWICYLFDAAIYPVLCGNYITKATSLDAVWSPVIALGVVFLMTLVKLAGPPPFGPQYFGVACHIFIFMR